MKARELKNLGIPAGEPLRTAVKAAGRARSTGLDRGTIRRTLRRLALGPRPFCDDPIFGQLARLLSVDEQARGGYVPRAASAPYRQWGKDLEPNSVRQLENACKLPVAVRGALMPDAHLGYGLPIGGVLATRNAVIPYAVGVDIACRMKMSILDLPLNTFTRDASKLAQAIESETRFGIGASFKKRRDHDVMLSTTPWCPR